jgi:hypothetical protein
MSTFLSQKCGYLSKVALRLIRQGITVETNSVALVRERTIPTERPPRVCEVSANFCG